MGESLLLWVYTKVFPKEKDRFNVGTVYINNVRVASWETARIRRFKKKYEKEQDRINGLVKGKEALRSVPDQVVEEHIHKAKEISNV